jgi:hypothetical protein
VDLHLQPLVQVLLDPLEQTVEVVEAARVVEVVRHQEVRDQLVHLIVVVQAEAVAVVVVLVAQLVQMEVLGEMEIHLELEERVIQEEQVQVEMRVVTVPVDC